MTSNVHEISRYHHLTPFSYDFISSYPRHALKDKETNLFWQLQFTQSDWKWCSLRSAHIMSLIWLGEFQSCIGYIFLILHSIDFPRCLVCNIPVHPQVNLQTQTSKSFPTRTPASFLTQVLPACFSYVANSGMNLWVLASYLNEELSLWLH
jgi:hypothetical protein